MKYPAIILSAIMSLAASAQTTQQSALADTLQPEHQTIRVIEESTLVAVPASTDSEPAGQPTAKTVATRGFAWGVELASNIDMGCDDMSSLAFDAYFGYRAPVFPILGAGAGVNVPLSNSARSIPLFAILRTHFTPSNSLIFMDVRGGLSVNYLENDKRQTGAYASASVGINLARGASFMSYLMAGYSFYERRDYFDYNRDKVILPSLHLATVRFGISF